ncbi:Cyclic AMP-dependent transcription factor ATF-7 [Mortierella antarctica]|nr:Cyclic AMP-dependent transcription factor ATF-7 [Mortierella antarctica]
MSLEADIRRDANPTPTRFLLECGAFTPGFGLSLDNYNPFDASLKFLNTGTPKAELNPFDTSFRAPSSAVSTQPFQSVQQKQEIQGQQEQDASEKQRSFDRQAWADMLFSEDALPMPQMSPGLSPFSSSSSSTGTLSPPISFVPSGTVSLGQVQASPAAEAQSTQTHTYKVNPVYGNTTYSKAPHQRQREPSLPSAPLSIYDQDSVTAPTSASPERFYALDSKAQDKDFDDDDDGDFDQEMMERADEGGVGTAVSALDMQPTSESTTKTKDTKGTKNTKAAKTRKAVAAQNAPGSLTRTPSSSRKYKSRKRGSAEEEGPEKKRLKFLERNRMAAAKCREKKRLQTLKTISDADEITTRNQALHETLEELQEEVRRLKTQILCHRGCDCSVIKKFVETSFECNSLTSPTTHAPAPLSFQAQQMSVDQTQPF